MQYFDCPIKAFNHAIILAHIAAFSRILETFCPCVNLSVIQGRLQLLPERRDKGWIIIWLQGKLITYGSNLKLGVYDCLAFIAVPFDG